MEDEQLNPSSPPCLHLISAFFAMEPNLCLISLARECGGGSITTGVQSLILQHCIERALRQSNGPGNLYVKSFLKKLIVEVESGGDDVLDGLYQQFAHYITSIKDDILAKGNTRVCKTVTFLFPDDCHVKSCQKSMKLEVSLRCSLNMLEGGTGCSVWPSSLYLSEFILSYPEIFSTKSCFEVGSGAGLVGICLAAVQASEVILTDGDMSTLANLRLNLDLNNLRVENEVTQGTSNDIYRVKCKYLLWEFASESELQVTPDIVLGADVMYDPSCIPHLVRVLSILLKPKVSKIHKREAIHSEFIDNHVDNGHRTSNGQAGYTNKPCAESHDGPIAYIVTIIRNVETYNYFLKLASEAGLSVADITGKQKPLNLLPYMQSYDRSCIHLLTISSMSN